MIETALAVFTIGYLAIGLFIACIITVPKASRESIIRQAGLPISNAIFPVLFIFLIFAWVVMVKEVGVPNDKEDK